MALIDATVIHGPGNVLDWRVGDDLMHASLLLNDMYGNLCIDNSKQMHSVAIASMGYLCASSARQPQ